jgi:hypothetical protein
MKVEVIGLNDGVYLCKDYQGFFFDVFERPSSKGFRWQFIYDKPDGITDWDITEAVQNWKLKKSLSINTANTFSNLIDEL